MKTESDFHRCPGNTSPSFCNHRTFGDRKCGARINQTIFFFFEYHLAALLNDWFVSALRALCTHEMKDGKSSRNGNTVMLEVRRAVCTHTHTYAGIYVHLSRSPFFPFHFESDFCLKCFAVGEFKWRTNQWGCFNATNCCINGNSSRKLENLNAMRRPFSFAFPLELGWSSPAPTEHSSWSIKYVSVIQRLTH